MLQFVTQFRLCNKTNRRQPNEIVPVAWSESELAWVYAAATQNRSYTAQFGFVDRRIQMLVALQDLRRFEIEKVRHQRVNVAASENFNLQKNPKVATKLWTNPQSINALRRWCGDKHTRQKPPLPKKQPVCGRKRYLRTRKKNKKVVLEQKTLKRKQKAAFLLQIEKKKLCGKKITWSLWCNSVLQPNAKKSNTTSKQKKRSK